MEITVKQIGEYTFFIANRALIVDIYSLVKLRLLSATERVNVIRAYGINSIL